MNTKSVQLTEDEIHALILNYGREISAHGNFNADFHIERLRYLNKRLKDFKEPEVKETSDNDNPTKKEPMSSW